MDTKKAVIMSVKIDDILGIEDIVGPVQNSSAMEMLDNMIASSNYIGDLCFYIGDLCFELKSIAKKSKYDSNVFLKRYDNEIREINKRYQYTHVYSDSTIEYLLNRIKKDALERFKLEGNEDGA